MRSTNRPLPSSPAITGGGTPLTCFVAMDCMYKLVVSVYQLIVLLPAPSNTVGPPMASTQFAPSRGGVTGRGLPSTLA